MRSFWRVFIGILALATVVFLIIQFVVGGYSTANTSMQPELQVGDRLLINKMAYCFDGPSRGEIINYKLPGEQTSQLKRIIGLPADIIEIKNNSIYVNGIKLEEPYAKNAPEFTLLPYQVPLGNYFAMEDNRNYDSLSPGSWTIPQRNIIGKAWILVWPPNKWSLI